ncbi:MAG: alpha/beta fold hydrolase [Pseudomonadota bacterium]
MVRTGNTSRPEKGHIAGFVGLGLILLWLVGCTATRGHQSAIRLEEAAVPGLDADTNTFTSFDGAKLGLSVWQAQGTEEPEHIVVGIHGMNDYAAAFEYAAPWWAERGVTTYAYDQRGFGRSVGRGRWPQEELMREDLREAVRLANARHPNATLTVVGISMGAAVAMTTFGSDTPPVGVDRLILSGPGLRGWGGLPVHHRASLWASSKARPGWIVKPPKFAVQQITPSDNMDMLIKRGQDPLNLFENRIDQVYGVVSVMENGHKAAPRLPENTFLLYGARDDIIPKSFLKRTAPTLPDFVRTAYYENGYHMLMRDLQAETVWSDQLAFMMDPEAPLPSGALPIPWAP